MARFSKSIGMLEFRHTHTYHIMTCFSSTNHNHLHIVEGGRGNVMLVYLSLCNAQ